MPKRIKKAIELILQGEPVYVALSYLHGKLGYETGQAMASTWADAINVDMEHEPFDVRGLQAFMEGLVAGGPTASGHRTPAVIVQLPLNARGGAEVRANDWMFKQVLSQGVHGVMLTHAGSPEAATAFVEGCRFPFQTAGVGAGLEQGWRGSSGERFASTSWGVDPAQYLRVADPWPLNPAGELILGVKVENRFAINQVATTCAVPGLCAAEWGPADMAFSFGYAEKRPHPTPPELEAAGQRLRQACRDNGLNYWHAVTPDNVRHWLDEGARFLGCYRDGENSAAIGRRHWREKKGAGV